LQQSPKIPIGKGKYGCRYCNKAPKFQLIKASMDVSIARKLENLVGRGKYMCRYCNEPPKFQFVKVSMGVGIATKPQNSSW